MKRYLLWSGGEDSSATCILAAEKGIRLDGVVMSEIMFDKNRGISAEHPDHINWIYDEAVQIIEKKLGYKVIILRGEKDYLDVFNHRILYSKAHPDRVGKKAGFVLGGNKCALKRDCKIKVINDWCKKQGEFEKIVGICSDEEKRLLFLNKEKNQRSILAEYGIAKVKTSDICKSNGLHSPFYKSGRKRQGCWFCPNCDIREFAALEKNYPNLWQELNILSQDKEIVSKCFKYDRTFESVDREVKTINNQISIFDFIGGN